MKIIQIRYLIFLQTLVSAVPRLANYPNATYGTTRGNYSTILPISNSSRDLDPDITNSASSTNNTYQLPTFPTAGNWTNLTCEVIDGSSFIGSVAWANSSASDAWEQLLAGWNTAGKPELFTKYAWSAFHFQNQPACLFDDSVPQCGKTLECGENGSPPAASLILDSLVYIYEMFDIQDEALSNAYESTSGQMIDLAATFAPTEQDSDKAEKILDIIDTILGFVSAGTLSKMFSEFNNLEHATEQIETIKNIVEESVSIASTALENIPKPQSDGETSDILSSILSKYYVKLRNAQKNTLNTLLNITDSTSQQRLTSLVQSGLVLNRENDQTNSSTDITELTIQMLWGKMIPAAWAILSTPQIPFVLRVDKADHVCNTPFAEGSTLATLMSAKTASSSLWCDSEGNSFFLLRANFDRNYCPLRGCLDGNSFVFEQLSGANSDTLTGDSEQFGGITIADMINSSWTGFVQNGKKNGYELSTTSPLANTDGLPFLGGINTPGFFNFTICLDPQEASHNILHGEVNSQAICGTIPQVTGSTGDINAPGQFTPGLCKIHVIQFQRNEGNENLLNTYQLQVNIFDNAGLQVGSATKQNAANPLILVDTVLPYNLIIAAQGPDDSSTVNFWYSDQWWTSNDQAHHCNFGPYDSGYRQGDCNFDCPLPSDDPPASATITQPVPSGAVAAVGGTQTFSNSFTTPVATLAITTTTPAPAPTPTYATGWCGMHIEQYQKNEGDENPTKNFELEITIFDAKQKPIGSSGIVQAPTGQPVSVTGLISPLEVTTSAFDDDPLSFSFNGRQWTSHDCSIGDYDSGNRNMDCGFSC